MSGLARKVFEGPNTRCAGGPVGGRWDSHSPLQVAPTIDHARGRPRR
jgi:hypothetical protein